MEIYGKVVHAMEAKHGVSASSGKPWTSREYVLEIDNGQYSPKHMVFSIFGEEKIKQFALRKDELVTVHFDIDAREWQGKWFNKITAFNITRQQGTPYVPPQQPQPQGQQQMPPGEYPKWPQQPQQQYVPPQQQEAYTPPQQQPADAGDDLPF